MHYSIRLEHAPAGCRLAVVKDRATSQDLSKVVPRHCGTVWDVLRAQSIKGVGRHVALYLDDEINLEVGVELTTDFTALGNVVGSELPSGTVATVTHLGPYDQLGHAHRAVRDWCRSQGRPIAGPNWEIYGHWVEAWNRDPSKIRTDVFYLLSSDGGGKREGTD